jgi:hypothetical protein
VLGDGGVDAQLQQQQHVNTQGYGTPSGKPKVCRNCLFHVPPSFQMACSICFSRCSSRTGFTAP